MEHVVKLARRVLIPAALASIAVTASAQAQAQPLPADSMAIGRRFIAWLYAGQTDSLWAHTADATKTQMGSKDRFTQMLLDLTSRAGTEKSVVEEKFITRNGSRQYWREANFSTLGEPVVIRLVMERDGKISGFGVSPKSSAPAPDPK